MNVGKAAKRRLTGRFRSTPKRIIRHQSAFHRAIADLSRLSEETGQWRVRLDVQFRVFATAVAEYTKNLKAGLQKPPMNKKRPSDC